MEEPRWLARHHQALLDPRGVEIPLVKMYRALVFNNLDAVRCGAEMYRQWHLFSQGFPVEEDYLLEPEIKTLLSKKKGWVLKAQAFIQLLNHQVGRLDCSELSWGLNRAATRKKKRL